MKKPLSKNSRATSSVRVLSSQAIRQVVGGVDGEAVDVAHEEQIETGDGGGVDVTPIVDLAWKLVNVMF